MTSHRGTRATALALAVVVAAATLTACTGTPTTSTGSTTTGPVMTPVDGAPGPTPQREENAAAPTTTAAPADPDPVSRWALAQSRLKAAHRATYTIVGTLAFGDGEITHTRRFAVDADAHTLEVRGKHRGGRDEWDFELVVAPSGAYARVPAGSGAWHRATDLELASAGVGRDPADVSALPEPLRSFVAQSDVGFGEVSGNVDVGEGLIAAGLGAFVADDKELASSIGGSLYTTVTLDRRGALVKAVIDGADSTGWDATTVFGGSKEMPEADLVALYSVLDVEITVDSVDRPLDIHVPRRSQVSR